MTLWSSFVSVPLASAFPKSPCRCAISTMLEDTRACRRADPSAMNPPRDPRASSSRAPGRCPSGRSGADSRAGKGAHERTRPRRHRSRPEGRLQKEAATCFYRLMLFKPDFRESEEARCRAHIERGLQGAAVPEKLVRDLAGAMMDGHAVRYTEGASNPSFPSLVRQSRGWAVRDCNFDFVANLMKGPLLGLGTGAATAAGPGSTL